LPTNGGPDGVAHDARRIIDHVLSTMKDIPEVSDPAGRAALMAAIANEAMSRMANQSRALVKKAHAHESRGRGPAPRQTRPTLPPDHDGCDCGWESEAEAPVITKKPDIH
jgi:hypothetical protein